MLLFEKNLPVSNPTKPIKHKIQVLRTGCIHACVHVKFWSHDLENTFNYFPKKIQKPKKHKEKYQKKSKTAKRIHRKS